MKTGIELITDERNKQIEIGYTLDHDLRNNGGGSLEMAVVGTLLGNPGSFPADWDNDSANTICEKAKVERLIIAGSLLAAEIDRLNASGSDTGNIPKENNQYDERVMKSASIFDDQENSTEYDFAKILVAAQAEAIRHIANKLFNCPKDEHTVEYWLLEHGYVPAPEEGEQNGH